MTSRGTRGPAAGGRGQGRQAGRSEGRPRGRFAPRRRVCAFCVEHVKMIDYKDVERLLRYITDRAKIEPRRRSGVCSKHQRPLRTAIQRARHLALVPFVPFQFMRSSVRR